MKKTTLFLTLAFIFQLALAQKQLPADIRASIQKRIEIGYTPSMVVGIIDKDGTHYYNFGTKTIGGEEVNEHSIYEIGSITKTFTAIMLAQMSLEGKLKTDDPAQNYLPTSVKLPARDGKQITLGHLSDHSSSLVRMPNNLKPKDPANPYADYTPQQLYDFLNGLTLTRDIGSAFEYSNLAVGLLGHILSTKEGKAYEDMMINRIVKPLGMNETRITFNDKMKKNLAMPYANGMPASNWDIATLTGAGAIRSSAFDMLRYVAANMGLQKSAMYPAMQLSHQPRHDKAGAGTRVGLGWFITKGAEGDIIWHNGATGGYRAFAGFVKETGTGVVVMTNSDKGGDDIGMRLLNSAAKLITVKKSAIDVIEKAMQAKGISAGLQSYADLKKQKDEYGFDENAINAAGYKFLQSGKVAEAIAFFKINIDEFPNSFNVYDSYAEALMTEGKKDSAIANYKKSLELNPGNTNATDMIAKMNGVAQKDLIVEESVLATYDGVYELAPGFTITVTHSGKQLFGQATGQEKFELFATSTTEFYLKVVPAKVVFFVKDGKVESLTLFQGGKEIPGKKIN